MMSTASNPEKFVAWTLRVGAYLSFALLLIAMALGFAGELSIAETTAKAGVLVLLATPLLRIIAALIMYAGERDRKMMVVSAVLLLIVVGVSVLGVKLH